MTSDNEYREMPSTPIVVRVWGQLAMFTRPDTKSEPLSYPVATPSAMIGLLKSIFFKPEIEYRVGSIEVCKPIQFVTMRLNGVRLSDTGNRPIDISSPTVRVQRTCTFLEDVEYIVRGRMVLRPHTAHPIGKYRQQFHDRLERGQCFRNPCLGLRECAAHFAPVEPGRVPIDVSMDLGRMLMGIAYCEDPNGPIQFARHSGATRAEAKREVVSGRAVALFRRVSMEHGILHVPQDIYDDIASFETAFTSEASNEL